MNFSCFSGDMHGLSIMFLNDYIPTVTHVLEFTEEYLTVFWIKVHALFWRLFLVIWHLGQDDKITLILYTNVYIFKVIFNQESWQYVLYSVCKL